MSHIGLERGVPAAATPGSPYPERTPVSKRTLRLVKETLTPLDTDALSSVVGGISLPNPACLPHTFQFDCLNDMTFEVCPMPTLPLEQCL